MQYEQFYGDREGYELGHEVRLISPQFVTPYVKSNKNDRNDAEAICEAVGLWIGVECWLWRTFGAN